MDSTPTESLRIMNWPSWVLGGLALLLSLVGFLWNRRKSDTEASVHLVTDLGNLKERCSLLEMKIGIFWKLVEENLSGMLKKPTHFEMDGLLDKLKAHTLTLEEAQRLRRWLQRVYLEDEASHAQQRLTAILVLAAVESLIGELERVTQ